MHSLPKQASSTVTTCAGVAVAILLSFAGIAQAQNQQVQNRQQQSQQAQPPDFNWFADFYSQPSAPGLNWQLFNRSGTLGRQGLGASPLHPEGPGNASF
jgi:hypothetical protein